MFQKATKQQAYLRAALFGPSGAGKTFSALRIAKGLVENSTADGFGKEIALIDTERSSASKYSDRFNFWTVGLNSHDIGDYCAAIEAASVSGFGVLVIDSLSHAWTQLLNDVEKLAQAKYRGNSWSAWSEGTPMQKRLIGALLDFPGHILATMRTKTAWEVADNGRGKTRPIRVGLAPEQGKGIEYEFDLLMELTVDHTARILKDRTGKYQDKIIEKPGEDLGKELHAWLREGEPLPVEEIAPAYVSEQVTLLKATIEEQDIATEKVEAWLKHFEVSTLDALMDEQVAAILTKIQSKANK